MTGSGCPHLAQTRTPPPEPGPDPVCEECVKSGSRWVHLRICLTCGQVGCDSSPNRHARRHAAHAGHAVVASAEPGEDWRWCFVDEEYV
jgi:uncharacterized UBP type Zn finger protein